MKKFVEDGMFRILLLEIYFLSVNEKESLEHMGEQMRLMHRVW